ncbi:MAG: transglycosylase SLT domain-containing protein [Candidatus Colwellbacteria bacterium]|jgi:hypothetical protein|nr:transglycosylase SLT domain-containing protein [Candidatus Colwellbacteria bacterium]
MALVSVHTPGVKEEKAPIYIQSLDSIPMMCDNTLLPIADPNSIIVEPKIEPRVTGIKLFDYDDLIDKYDWDSRLMKAIFYAESQLKPNAVNAKDRHKGCSGSYGIAQIGCVWFGKHGLNWDNWNDPETNIRVAYEIYKEQGLNAWSVYRNGSYLKYY